MQEFVAEQGMSSRLFLARLDCISVLASDYLDFVYLHNFVGLHFKRSILDNKRPNVIAKTVGMEMTLDTMRQK